MVAVTERLLTLADVAELLACSDNKVWYLTRDGKLPGIKVGRTWRYRRQDIERYLDSQQVAEQR